MFLALTISEFDFFYFISHRNKCNIIKNTHIAISLNLGTSLESLTGFCMFENVLKSLNNNYGIFAIIN